MLLEDGGYPLFDFVVKAHRLIAIGHLSVADWIKMVKVIFRQIIECVEYLHQHGVIHFDLSLENMLINDVQVDVMDKGEITQMSIRYETAQIKVVDFGLAEKFGDTVDFSSNKYCGKTRYQSPEITKQKAMFDAKSNDVWCMGVTLFMLVVGSYVIYYAVCMFIICITHCIDLLFGWPLSKILHSMRS